MTKSTSLISSIILFLTKRERLRSLAFVAISLSVFVVIWWLGAIVYHSEYLPTPPQVYDAFIKSFTRVDPFIGNTMWQNIYVSLIRLVEGFLLALAVAIPLGLLMGYFRTVDALFKPVVELFRPIPPIAWVPFFLITLKFFWGPIMIIFIGVFFPLLSSVYFGVKSVDPILLDAARTQGAGRTTIFTKVILPFTVPFMMTGIRIGLGIGWMCIVAAEMISSEGGGIGYFIYTHGNVGDYPGMFAGIAVIALLGIATTGVSTYIENRMGKRMGLK